MQPETVLGKKQLLLLSKLLIAKRPDVASELMAEFFPKTEPFAKDFDQINLFFQLFCKVQNLSPDDFSGPLYKSHKVDQRRLFISSILHLYCPDAFIRPEDPLISYGLLTRLCDVLRLTKPGIHKLIRQVVLWETEYDDYQQKVAELTTLLKQLINDGAES